MEKTWDNIMSLLVSSNPQAILDLSFSGCRFIKHHRNKLRSSERQPDAIIEAWSPLEDCFLLNGEFQTYKEKRVPERLLMYNVLLAQQYYPLPVRSEVFYLLSNQNIEQPPLSWPMPGEPNREMLRFQYSNTEMWRKSPDDLLRLEHVELLTMLPLTQGGMERDVVEMMFAHLAEKQHYHLATIGFLFAALAFRHAKRYDDQQWLERRYNHMHDILRDSPAYQWILDEGREEGESRGRILGRAEGRAEGLEEGLRQGSKALQQAAIGMVVKRFADLEELAKTRITALDNPTRLQGLIIDLTIAYSREEIERVLLSL